MIIKKPINGISLCTNGAQAPFLFSDHKMQLPSNKDTYRNVLALDTANAPTIETSREYIYGIDFSMIKYKLMKPDPNISRVWDEEAIDDAIGYYKNFLFLLRKYGNTGEPIPPSVEIDEIWHHHILDTYKYHEDCAKIFGQYLHHYPYFGMRGEGDKANLLSSFRKTQELHLLEFGEYIPSFEEDDYEINIQD